MKLTQFTSDGTNSSSCHDPRFVLVPALCAAPWLAVTPAAVADESHSQRRNYTVTDLGEDGNENK